MSWIVRLTVLESGKKGGIFNDNEILGKRIPSGKEMTYELIL